MRTSVLILLVLLVTVLPCRSQKITVGLKGGSGFSDFSSNRIYDVLLSSFQNAEQKISMDSSNSGYTYQGNFRISGTGGAYINYQSRERLSFQAEILYVPKGLNQTYEIQRGPNTIFYDRFTRLDYLEVPLLIKFALPSRRILNWYATAGIAPAYLLSSRRLTVPATRTSEQPFLEELQSNGFPLNKISESIVAKRFALGALIGGGLDVNLGKNWFIQLDGRYTRGLTTIRRESSPISAENAPVRTRTYSFMISVGYQFSKASKLYKKPGGYD